MTEPKISIILITYNRSHYIKEAIGSVLAQSFKDWELLIIDDASTDDTKKIIENLMETEKRIKYFFNKANIGISRSRNLGLSLAQGKYIAIIDSDDIWDEKNKLKNQYDFLENNQDYALVGGGVIVIDQNGQETKRYYNPESDEKIRKKILFKNPFAHSSVMYLKGAALNFGGYDPNLKTLEDYDLYLKIGTKHKLHNLKKYYSKYRVHAGNITAQERANMMKLNIVLINKYKKNYPNYWIALTRRRIRLFIYNLFLIFKFFKYN